MANLENVPFPPPPDGLVKEPYTRDLFLRLFS